MYGIDEVSTGAVHNKFSGIHLSFVNGLPVCAKFLEDSCVNMSHCIELCTRQLYALCLPGKYSIHAFKRSAIKRRIAF